MSNAVRFSAGSPFREFRDKDGRRVIWYDRDRLNVFGQHNPHKEYANLEAIAACIRDPDEIRRSMSGSRRRCLYRVYRTAAGAAVTMKCVIAYVFWGGVLVTAYHARPHDK
jgi:hypothetical protein